MYTIFTVTFIGGVLIEVTGTNFTDEDKVMVGGMEVIDLDVVNSTYMTSAAPGQRTVGNYSVLI